MALEGEEPENGWAFLVTRGCGGDGKEVPRVKLMFLA